MPENEKNMEDRYITEFTETFFDNETKKIIPSEIKRIVDKVEKRQSRKSEPGEGIWTDIFEVLMGDYTIGDILGLSNQNNSGVGKILEEFYSNNFLFYYEIAQLLKYNLDRLDGNDAYDIYTDIKNLLKYIDIGRKKYKNASEGNIEEVYEDIIDELPEDLDKIEQRHKNDNGKVRFEKKIEGKAPPILYLDNRFREVHLLYIANDKFRNFISRNTNGLSLKKLLCLIQDLEEDCLFNITYLWERMTNFNSLILMAEFWGWIYRDISNEEIRKNVMKYRKIIHSIERMPNTMTRIIFLKEGFQYIAKIDNSQGIKSELKKMYDYLSRNSIRYGDKIDKFMQWATIVRWNYGDKDAHKKECWKKELSKEFPLKLFKMWRKSLNLRNVMSYRTEGVKSRIVIITRRGEMPEDWIENVIQGRKYAVNLCIALNAKIEEEYIKDMVAENNCKKDLVLSQRIQNAIEEYKKIKLLSYSVRMGNDEEKIVKKMMEDQWEITVYKSEDLKEIPIGEVVTDIEERLYNTKTDDEKEHRKKKVDDECIKKYLKKEIKLWRTSKYEKVMIEKIPENKKVCKILEILMKI